MATKKNKTDWKFGSIQEAYERCGKQMIDFSHFPEQDRKHMENYYHGITMVEAIRRGSVLDWTDWRQWKYIAWFVMSPSVFRFDGTDFDITGAFAGGGSRLRLLSAEQWEWLATEYPDVWKEVQLG